MKLDHRAEVLLGIALTVAGAYLIYDAHEGRGRKRSFLLSFVPGY